MTKRLRAVVVGIDDYPGTEDDLPSCIADARYIARTLRDTFGFTDITELHDEAATLDAVTRALGTMLDGARDGDQLVFYYSGHGTQTIRHDELRESLCLHDRLLNDDVLVEASQHVPPGVFTVILDACFSGGMAKDFALAARRKARVLTRKAALIPRRYRAFGAGARDNYGPMIAAKSARVVDKLVDETGPRLNGLLVSACLENETAAASTASTDGLSAFTYGLRGALARAPGASAEMLMQDVAEILRSIHIVQSPQLHPPLTPAMHRRPLFADNIDATTPIFDDALLERVMRLSAKAAARLA